MPTRSPGDASAGTISDLGLPARAVAALTRAGIRSTRELAALTRRDLTAIPGLGPGLIAAIRHVVPEPPTGIDRPGSPTATRRQSRSGRNRPDADRDPGEAEPPDEEESPAAPAIPSFDSLRAPRRRTAVDLLAPPPPPPPSPSTASADGASAPSGPRPAEYADLLRLGMSLARALATLPGRLVLWWFREPVHCLRRLVADRSGAGGAPGPGPH